jgi:hypothetical protein
MFTSALLGHIFYIINVILIENVSVNFFVCHMNYTFLYCDIWDGIT